MVYNVSAFLNNPEIAEVLTRCATLRSAMQIWKADLPSMRQVAMPLKEKNAFYDSVFSTLANLTK